MAELAPLLVSALILGLLGGGHCLGMCGGLMGALTLAIPAEQRGRRLRLLLAYNLGRILSYACAGLLLGLAGWAVARTPLAGALRVVAGLLLIAMGLYLAGWWSGLTRVEALGRGLWRHLEPFAGACCRSPACHGPCCSERSGAGCPAGWSTAPCSGPPARDRHWTARC
ncbi:cytochrome biogenesis protein [Pseudomonas aeruginosa]|nr:cytochrome biogenesis protein [Pseudomonas aeruginosa]